MSHERQSNLLGAFLGLLGLLAGADQAFCAAPFAQRPVAAVLDDLQDASLQFLYSSDLVPDSLRVAREPRTRDRLGIAREVLAEHGLAIRSVSPTLYIVVRANGAAMLPAIEGRVVDAQSGAALGGARVELVPLGRVTWSDVSGRFEFGGLPTAGDYRLLATIDDYARGEARLEVRRAVPREPSEVRLQRVDLDTVVVETSRYALLSAADEGALRVDGMQLAYEPEVTEDPVRSLRRLPGVIQGGISANSNVRGGASNEVLVLLDGFPLRQPFHLPGYQSPFSLLDEDAIGSIDVFTGGYPARYGNRLAAVFDISSAPLGEPPRHALSLSFFNARARTSGMSADGRAGWRAAGRLGTMRPVLRYLSVDSGEPSYGDLALAASYSATDRLTLSGNALWADDEYQLDDDDEQAKAASRTRYAWLRADHATSEDLATSLWFGHSRITADRSGFIDKPELTIGAMRDHRDAEFWDLRGLVHWQWNPRGRLNAGFEWARGAATYRHESFAEFSPPLAELFDGGTGFERSADLRPRQQRWAWFVSQRWKLADRLVPEIGVRLQNVANRGLPAERTWDPRVGLRWEVSPVTALRAHWGRFHQAEEVHELAVADGQSAFQRAQRSDHLILGLEHAFANGTQLRVEAFRKQQQPSRAHFENLMSPMDVLAELAPDRARIAPDEARIRGVELSLAWERESWRLWSALSLARAVDVFDEVEVPRSWEQRHAFSAGLDWRRGQWRVGAAAALRSGWPSTPVNYTEEDEPVLAPRNSGRLSTFAALDLRAEYRRPLAVGSLAIALEIANLSNRRNQCCFDVEVEDPGTDEEAIMVETKNWPRLLPSLSIEWQL
jgi:hypothetical protein